MKQLFVLFLFISSISLSQKPWGGVHITAVDPCSGEEEEDFQWKLVSTDGKVVYESNPLGRDQQIAKIYEAGDYYVYEQFSLEPGPIGKVYVPLNDTIYLHQVYRARISRNNCVCSPPDPNYYDCGELADGRIVDSYHNGRIRLEGTFGNGLPVDTLREYSIDGVLLTRISPEGNGLFRREYFDEKGMLTYDFSQKEGYVKTYTDSTAQFMFWDKKNRYRYEDYFKGHLVQETTEETDVHYDTLGMVTATATRKELDKWRRLFSLDSWERHFRYYEYTVNIELGADRSAIIKFWSDEDFESGRPFPKSVAEIDPADVTHIYVYNSGQLIEHYTAKKRKFNEEKDHPHSEYTQSRSLSEQEIKTYLEKNF